MSKLRRKASRRVMAIALSAAMIMSNLTVTATEVTDSGVEPVVEAEETVASSEVVIEEENVSTASAVSEEASSETAATQESAEAEESSTEKESSVTEETTTEEASATEESETEENSSAEETSGMETTSEEVTSEEETTTEEETIALMSLDEPVEADLYVAPDADGDGLSADDPMDFVNAINEIQPGYTIKMAPGTYQFNKTILIEEDNAGKAGALKSVVADGGDVVFDFSGMGYSGSDADKSNRGIVLDGSYWKFYGITIKEAADNGMLLSGDNNILEMCVFEGNHDTGLQVSRYQTGYDDISEWPSNNLIKNCTSFNNVDIEGENADGFAAKLTCGEGNVFDGCMAYNNSDDGWDLYAKTATGPIGVVTLKNCIAFRNGKLTNGEGSAQGDMNGFKLGGSGVGTPHKLVNCIAFENGAHGFTDNNNPTAVSLTNCTSFNNSRYESKKSNFQMNRESGGINSNLLSFTTDSMGSDAFIGTINNSVYYNNKPAYYSVTDKTVIAKGDKLGEIVTVSSSDFVSVTAPGTSTDFHTTWRDENGNIDTKGFLKVAENSDYATMASDGKALGARLSGDEYMVVVPDSGEEDNKEEEKDSIVGTIGGTDTFLNVSDLTASTLTEATTVGDFIINATSSKTVVIDANAKSIDDFSFTQRMKLGGTGKVDYRNVEYTATDAATMTVYAMSSSSSADRALVLVDKAGTTVASQTALGASISKLTYEIPEAGTYYLYSADSGINLYYVGVDYPEVVVEDPKPVLPEVDVIESIDGKIDVWDLAAEQLDTTKYTNKLTEDIINSWYPDTAAGTKGANIATFQVKDDAGNVVLGFNDGGYPATHRLRTMNTNLTRYDEKNKTFGGVTYNGFIYSNKAASADVYIEMYAEAGDIFTFAVSSNGTEADYVFEAPNGSKQTATYDAAEAGTLMTFYATEAGTYKLYTTKEKLVLLRAYVQHTQPVNVVGYVEAPDSLTSEYYVTFTNTSTDMVTEAKVSNGTYATVLNDGYTYEVALKNADGYVVTSEDVLTLNTGDGGENNYKQFDVTVGAVTLAEVSGAIKGIDAETAVDLTITLKADEIYVPVVKIDGTSWSAKLETNIEYAVEISGIDDYELVTPSTIKVAEAATQDIEIAKKPVYAITINSVGATAEDLAEATFTFARLEENEAGEMVVDEDYVYTFTGTENIELRDGVYSVVVENSGAYVQQLTSNLKVEGAAVTKTIKFSSDITEWVFTGDDYVGQSPYNGLVITGGKKHGSQYGMMIKNGTIEVPVSGECEVKVSVGYNWDISFDDGAVSYFDNTNSGDIDVSYNYTGKEGTVVINVGSQCTSYIKKIVVTEKAEYKEVITVGATGCDYTTINDALDAVRAMDRTSSQRITIEIQPGDYEEMLVIDTPNVTLKNASKNPSIETKNKGVDIDENAVRITSYYGHGYTYYSMGSDCKYDEELLTVNKENGYASFENPGSGTTNGSYWNATVVINANGVEAEGIIFENSFNQYVSKKAANDVIVAQSSAKEGSVARADMKAGDTTVQDKKYVERAAALAIYNNCKQISFDNCKFIGRQDTLYGGTDVTAAFYDCAVYGGTDYIFGGMTAVFAKCDLVFNTSEDKNDVGYITAAQTKSGRGMLMYNCTVTSTVPGVDTASEYTSKAGYFGRPWQANTGEAVFYNTVIEATDSHWYDSSASLIMPAGWLSSLSGESVMSAEYGTYEMAEDVDNQSARASWASTLTEDVLADGTKISVEAFLGDWDAFAGKDMTIVIPTDKVDNKPAEDPVVPGDPSATTEFVLDTTADLSAFAQGTKADGDTEKAGTEDYFTLIYSAKTKVDGSNKTFDDGYAATQRVNFGGMMTTEKNAVKFTTSNPATVKVWWVEGGDDNRQIAILDATGAQVAITNETLAKNATCISTFELAEAGTYYLGGATNNNYFFKVVVTEEAAAEPVVSTFDTANDLSAFAAGAKADGDTEKAGTNDYFTVIYSAKSKVDSSSKTFEDGYTSAQRLNFGGKVTTEKNAVMFTTSNAATVKIWWVEGGDDNRQMAILDNTGAVAAQTNVTAAKNATVISEFELANAGTYYLGGLENNNYIFKVEVTETPGGAVKPPRADWATVEIPEITNIALNAQDANKIDVTVKANIGYDGADKITVTMTDAAGVEAGYANSMKEGGEVTVSLTPSASGTYTFSVKAIRDGEEDKVCAETKTFDFVLPLTTPVIKSATSMGNGVVEVEWEAVKEAESYIVTVEGTDIKVETTELVALVEGLEIGKEYTFKVVAVRGEDVSEAGSIVATATENAQTKWAFSAFGQGVDTKNNGYEGNANDGSVRVYSNNGKGKVVPGSTDGLAFYYTEIDPETTNFTLTATAKVNNWKLSNGQEGFGLMAADAVGKSGDNSVFWNNSYMASVTKVEYVTEEGNKISMKLGVGSQEKAGVKAEDITEALTLKDMSVFSSSMTTLETSCAAYGAGTYNIVGNFKDIEPTGTVDDVTEFKLTIQKNNTGYFVSYTDEAGNTTTNKYYGTDVLNYVDKDSVYVGFYASRNADITFTDIQFTTIAPEDDAPAESRPMAVVKHAYAMESATVANQAAHDLVFRGNADGTLVIKDSKGNELVSSDAVKANEKVVVPVTLELGNNKYTVTFTPNADYKPSEYEVLDSYETEVIEHAVLFRQYGEAGDSLYVSPEGSVTGNGTKANPLDIYTAVKYVQAGQTIVIMEGTYNLTRTVKVERGINGTADKGIYMVADPEASTRPVFDFGGACAGMIFAGDYWYIKGFDVTRSADAQKGIQVSGDHNTLDQINAYKNGNTGIQISRYLGTDTYEDWPSYNLILNCTSYENADKGYEDADGFAAKLTVGDGNVFDGCIAHHNADDGWDLFAKVQTGSIGNVTIKNSIAYKNGYVLDENGNEVNAGNGNGFKMGGDSMSGQHVLENSIAFFNKAKGIDSNSGPDIKVKNSIAFNNQSYNVALYTNSAVNTDYEATGIVSYRTDYKDQTENIKPKGTQDNAKIYGTSNFYWDVATQKSVNTEGVAVADDWFESLTFTSVDRNADGTINMNGFLKLTDKAQAGENIGGTGSNDVVIGDETDGKIETGVVPGVTPGSGTTDDGSSDNNSSTDNGSSDNSSSSDSSSTTAVVNKTTVTIEDAATPLAAAPTLPGGYVYEQVNVSKDNTLRAELLNKYYGQKVYFAAIFGKNFGMTIDMQEVSAAATADMKLSYTLVSMPVFATGFDTVHAVPNTRTKLPMNVTLHFGVGSEYTGKIAYIYVLAEDAASYKLVTAMAVNEIGNVAIKTSDFTDVMILIAK